MGDASYIRDRHDYRLTAVAAIASGDVWQLPDGLAAVFDSLNAAAVNDRAKFSTSGQYTFVKAAGQVFLPGQELYWDHSAGAAVGVPPLTTGDRDFFIGSCVGGAASADTTAAVNLNV